MNILIEFSFDISIFNLRETYYTLHLTISRYFSTKYALSTTLCMMGSQDCNLVCAVSSLLCWPITRCCKLFFLAHFCQSYSTKQSKNFLYTFSILVLWCQFLVFTRSQLISQLISQFLILHLDYSKQTYIDPQLIYSVNNKFIPADFSMHSISSSLALEG